VGKTSGWWGLLLFAGQEARVKEAIVKEYVTLPIESVIPYERNPRNNDQAVDAVAESIRQVGYRAKIIVDENNVIIAGHTRLKALKKLGWKEVEVQRELDMTEEQKRKYRLLDNKVGEIATWNLELLDWELEDLDFEGFDFGFEDLDIDEPDMPEEEDDKYTNVVNIPQYEPSNECPKIDDLVDTKKYNELMKEIVAADLPDDIDLFLKFAAARHIGFNYKRIADFYAHQSADIQKLMENSALVIIDVDDAIKNGFTELTKRLDEIEASDDEK